MAKALCILKAALLTTHFVWEQWEQEAIARISEFIICIYCVNWFSCTKAADAAFHQLQMFKDLVKWRKVDVEIADIGLHKLSKHLWYLTEELVPMSLASDLISSKDKQAIASAILNNRGKPMRLGRPEMRNFGMNSTLASRVGPNSLLLFERLQIDLNWLKEPVEDWIRIPCYQKLKKFIDNVNITNDACERSVKTTSDYASKHSMKEQEFQGSLLVVNKVRHSKANYRKHTLAEYYDGKKKEFD